MNRARSRTLRPSKVLFYVYLLTALILGSVGIAAGSFVWYVKQQAAIDNEAANYHQASIDVTLRIEHEIALIVLALHEAELAGAGLHDEPATGNHGTPGQSLAASLHMIEMQMREATDLQAHFKGQAFAATMRRAAGQQRLFGETAAGPSYRQFDRESHDSFESRLEAFSVSIQQLRRLHSAALARRNTARAELLEWQKWHFAIVLLGLAAFAAPVGVLVLRLIRQNLERQERAEEKLRRNQERFRDFAESASDWLWETGPDLRVTYVSKRITPVLGVDAAVFLGKTREELLGGDPDDPAWQAHLADLRAGKPFRNFQYAFQAPDGTLRHLRISGQPAYDQRGAFLGYRGTGADQTAEVTARAESLRSLQILEAVFENLPEGISLADAELNMIAFNRRFLELLDFPPEIFKPGDTFEKFIRYNAERGEYGPGDPDEQVRERVALAKRFEPHRLERARPDGGVLEIRGNPIPGGGFVTTYTDISPRVHAERSLRKAKDAAEQANRAKGEFLAAMSHELRTPLNAIIGFSELMAKGIFGPLGHANYRDYAEDILSSGTHLLNIINDILDVSKAEAGHVILSEDDLDLAEAVESALRLIRPRARDKQLTLETELSREPVYLRADEQRFRQVLLNMLSNAVKFTETGGITIEAHTDPEAGLSIRIVDTGVGLAQADIDRVFDPFVQASSTLSRSHEGTGLGLPLSRRLVELHGGTLTLESRLGTGTVVTIRLPAERLRPSADAA